MKRSVIWFVAVLALLVASWPAQLLASPASQDFGWLAEYYNNTGLTGSPVLTRYEGSVDYDWGSGSPGPMVPADNFSARWTRSPYFSAGNYTFCITVDDGGRLWVDGTLIIDQWRVQSPSTYCASLWLSAGSHTVQLAYFEATGGAVAKLWWTPGGGPVPTPYPPYPPSYPPSYPPPASASTAWLGEYFNNRDLSGSPTFWRYDGDINFDWGSGGPGGGLGGINFSVRWTRDLYFSFSTTYRFCMTVDDGGRLWIDGSQVLDEWREQSPREFCVDRDLGAGTHSLRMEYYQAQGGAVARLTWSPSTGPVYPPYPPAPGTGWYGEYFGTRYLSGPLLFTRVDPEINFNWGYGAPAAGYQSDNFSVRWTRDVYFSAGSYDFMVTHDDGVRVYVDGSLIIDAWWDQAAATHSATRYLSEGTHQIKVEYYENAGEAVIRFWWITSAGIPPAPWPTPLPPPYPPYPPYPPAPEPPPPPSYPSYPGGEVLIDNTDPGFVWGGPLNSRRVAYMGINGSMYWTYNSTGIPVNYGKWIPRLSPGYYEVFAYIPSNYATSTRVRYRILHNYGQRHDRVINQNRYADRWVSLGTYYFNGVYGNEFVLVYDNTGEYYGSTMIAFDAVKFVPRW